MCASIAILSVASHVSQFCITSDLIACQVVLMAYFMNDMKLKCSNIGQIGQTEITRNYGTTMVLKI